jgi:hypothetical protein
MPSYPSASGSPTLRVGEKDGLDKRDRLADICLDRKFRTALYERDQILTFSIARRSVMTFRLDQHRLLIHVPRANKTL